MKDILSGKVKTVSLNSHKVRVVVPSKSISYEEGVKEVRKILEKAVKQ